MKVAIIGAGLVGTKRAAAIEKIDQLRVAVVCDSDFSRAKKLAARHRAKVLRGWRQAVRDPDVDIVIVATPNRWLLSIALVAVKAKKHVLIEKPGATRASDLRKVLMAAKRAKVGAWVGYNHRFHPAVMKAYKLFKAGKIGQPLYIRGVYGQGGRKGYEKDWRALPHRYGGGEMMDQGSHLIDLFQYFLGRSKLKFASLKKYFWKMPVEDNAIFMLEDQAGRAGFFHTSWTQWKNKFTFEIFGTKGALVVKGLGRSYGPESLTLYTRPVEGGVPREKTWVWEEGDRSFLIELRHFVKLLPRKAVLYRRFDEAIRNLKIVESAYNF